MKIKKLQIENIEIQFYDNQSDGFPVVFIHGNSLNAGLFFKQFEDKQINSYRLIAPDLPGHGLSERSINPEKDYSVLSYIQLIKKFIRKLGLHKVAIFGHSLGGHIAIHLSKELSENEIAALVIQGTPPLTLPPELQKAFLPNPAVPLAFKAELNETEIETLSSSFINKENPSYHRLEESIRNCDPLVRPFIGKSISTEVNVDEAKILGNAGFPVAVFHGKDEQNVNPEYIKELNLPLWRNKIHYIEDAGHSAFLENPESFNSLFMDFLGETIP
jgi:pimeloyl-ACP methyl ester carboxylesterase